MLLDSNALVFWVTRSPTLSSAVQKVLTTAEALSISMATVWELEIKRGLGRLETELDWTDLTANRVMLLPIEIDDAILAGALPRHHRDPFDRMIIAQAMRRRLPVVTRDRAFEHYGVPVIWA